MKKLLWVLPALGLAAVLAVYLWLEPSTPEDRSPAHPVAVSGKLPTSEDPRSSTTTAPSRSPASSQTLSLVSATGVPIEGAVVTLTRTSINVPTSSEPDRLIRLKDIERATQQAEALGQGLYQFPQSNESTRVESVLWVTHLDYLGDVRLLPRGTHDLPAQVALTPTQGIRARVSSSAGSLEGAVVVQGLLFDEQDADAPRGSAYLRRVYAVDDDGQVQTAPLPGRQWLIASQGDKRSSLWAGRHPDACSLELHPLFTLEGRVRSEVSSDTRGKIEVRTQSAGFYTVLHRTAIRPDGTYGPIELPLLPVERYVIRMTTAGFVPQDVVRDPPDPGDRWMIDFSLVQGLPLTIRVQDPQGRPIDAATAHVTWKTDGEWTRVERGTDEDGLASFSALPPGELTVWATKDGHARSDEPPFMLESQLDEPLQLVMQPAGVLQGHCLWKGDPVHDFEVVYSSSRTGATARSDFRDREDGSFRLDDAPLGPLQVTAYSKSHARCETAYVDIAAGVPAEVELHLQSPAPITGVVVDGRTQEPVRDARVQAWNRVNGQIVTPWGPIATVQTDGSFTLLGGVTGENSVVVTSERHTRANRTAQGSASGVDFGVISLFAPQPLHFKLLAEQAMDLEACTLALSGPVYSPQQHLDARGEVRVEGLAPGQYSMTVTLADGRPLTGFISLHPNEDWNIEFPVPDHDPVVVQILPSPGEELPVVNVEISYRTAEGIDVYYTVGTTPEGVGRFFRPPSEFATIDVVSEKGRVGSRRIRPALITDTVLIEIDASTTTFRIVNGEREPIGGVDVQISLPDDDSGWYSLATTDQSGQFTTQGLHHEELVLGLQHPLLGSSPSIPVRVDREREIIEVVFDATHVLTVQLLDGMRPMTGVPIQLWDRSGRTLPLGSTPSDAEGFASWNRLSDAPYLARIAHPGLWFTEALVTPAATPTPIQVRRLGSVIVAPMREGAPAPGARVSLESLEFLTDVSEWHREGRARVMLRNGELTCEGLPNGPYRWTAEYEGKTAQGTLSVVAGQRVRVPIELP